VRKKKEKKKTWAGSRNVQLNFLFAFSLQAARICCHIFACSRVSGVGILLETRC